MKGCRMCRRLIHGEWPDIWCDDCRHAYGHGEESGQHRGAAVAFGLMGMAEAIREKESWRGISIVKLPWHSGRGFGPHE